METEDGNLGYGLGGWVEFNDFSFFFDHGTYSKCMVLGVWRNFLFFGIGRYPSAVLWIFVSGRNLA